MQLREYQLKAESEIYAAWRNNAQNVCAVMPTGAGKTILFAKILADEQSARIAIAHRSEIVSQISLALAKRGVRHNIIAQKQILRNIIALHMTELKRSYYDPTSRCHVAGVDTLIKMRAPWFDNVRLIVQDEGHHVLKNNKWGKVAALFPNARGLYPTATPLRADGHGLGRQADGIIDVLVIGPTMRALINQKYLTDYRVIVPPNDLDLSHVTLSATGDYSPPKLRNAIHKSHITGDVVSHYLKFAAGKLGVTFAVDVASAGEIAANFRSQGVPAEVITAKTPDLLRAQIMRRFRNREILQIVNVDLLGEGVDVPAIEVVSMARPTMSYALYAQQFGRALRPLDGKESAIILDHVGNFIRHGAPDRPRVWSLDRRPQRAKNANKDVIQIRVCLNEKCLSAYERYHKVCPFCGYYPVPADRSAPEFVDGDLLELSPDVLAKMRGEVIRVDGAPRVPQHLNHVAQRGIINRHHARQEMQAELRAAIAQWAGLYKAQNFSDSDIYRQFYYLFKIDILTAQTLGIREAEQLKNQLIGVINNDTQAS